MVIWQAGGVAELCVDLGCGSGQSAGPLAPHFASVVGVDVSQPQLDVAAQELKHLPNVSFRCVTIRQDFRFYLSLLVFLHSFQFFFN